MPQIRPSAPQKRPNGHLPNNATWSKHKDHPRRSPKTTGGTSDERRLGEVSRVRIVAGARREARLERLDRHDRERKDRSHLLEMWSQVQTGRGRNRLEILTEAAFCYTR